jgi:hypothetical protein
VSDYRLALIKNVRDQTTAVYFHQWVIRGEEVYAIVETISGNVQIWPWSSITFLEIPPVPSGSALDGDERNIS